MLFEPYRDPWNSAFTADVPAGWAVRGGCRRATAGDLRIWLELSSSGGVHVRFRDEHLPSRITHAPYSPAADFLETYVLATVSEPAVTMVRSRPDRAQPRLFTPSAYAQYHAGEIRFRAVRDGVPVEGSGVAITGLDQSGWLVDSMVIMIAPERLMPDALEAGGHLWNTVRMENCECTCRGEWAVAPARTVSLQ